MLLNLDLGARAISPSKCLTKYARENKRQKIAGIAHVKGAKLLIILLSYTFIIHWRKIFRLGKPIGSVHVSW